MKSWQIAAVLALATTGVSLVLGTQAAPTQPVTDGKVQVTLNGGHETEGRDRGRPVILIAGALGVPPEVFREAFSGVHPAHGRGPTEEEARANKDALMRVLGPYGITNERLDEVSNYYRYRREAGEMWPTEDAVVYAIMKKGKVTGFEVASGGAGYSSSPQIKIPGTPPLDAAVKLSFSKEFENNGTITSVALDAK